MKHKLKKFFKGHPKLSICALALVLVVSIAFFLFPNLLEGSDGHIPKGSLDNIPAFDGTSAYVIINDDKPFFTEEEIVSESYEKYGELDGLGIAEWTTPRGGYFVSLDILCGSASRVYELMKGVGVTLTQVGATFPYGRDPEDKNLRIAPTYPTDSDLALAIKLLTLSIKLSALEVLLNK